MKGVIALDIDGTLTDAAHSMPKAVEAALLEYADQGWILFFVTGRTFKWAAPLFKNFYFPYFLAVQNGAILLQMPEKKIIAKSYLDVSILDNLGPFHLDCAIYSGFENQDLTYYRRDRFTQEQLEYLDYRKDVLKETWVDIKSYQSLPISSFPSLKWIGREAELRSIARHFQSDHILHLPLIRDPVQKGYFVAQGTHVHVSKGNALVAWQKQFSHNCPVIAAGDDTNDLTLLKQANIKIAMQGAPPELIAIADIIAPPASKQGIVVALKQAIQKINA